MTDSDDRLAIVAYEAYAQSAIYRPHALPTWQDLPERARDLWRDITAAVAAAHTADIRREMLGRIENTMEGRQI